MPRVAALARHAEHLEVAVVVLVGAGVAAGRCGVHVCAATLPRSDTHAREPCARSRHSTPPALQALKPAALKQMEMATREAERRRRCALCRGALARSRDSRRRARAVCCAGGQEAASRRSTAR
jgi:hypothetical protein